MARKVSVSLSEDLATELEAVAAAEGVSVDQVIEDAIRGSILAWRQRMLSSAPGRDSVEWRRRVNEHIARKYAQKELPKDFNR